MAGALMKLTLRSCNDAHRRPIPLAISHQVYTAEQRDMQWRDATYSTQHTSDGYIYNKVLYVYTVYM